MLQGGCYFPVMEQGDDDSGIPQEDNNERQGLRMRGPTERFKKHKAAQSTGVFIQDLSVSFAVFEIQHTFVTRVYEVNYMRH